MNLLLDSHAALWWVAGDASLGANAIDAIENADRVAVSVVTPWELGIKRATGKLGCPEGLSDVFKRAGFVMLPITADHAERAPMLAGHHRDPFDRMLVAQAELEAMQIVTADPMIGRYGVAVIDARD